MIEEPELRPSITELSIYFIKIHFLVNDKSLGENLYLLGVYYENKDIKKSIYYLTLAAEQVNLNALNELASIYFDHTYGVFDIQKSIYYFTISADNNDQIAQLYLGLIYLYGIYIEPNVNKAIKYLTLSSSQNNPNAQYFLGSLYFKGKYYKTNTNNLLNTYTHDIFNIIQSSGFEVRSIPCDIDKAIYYLTLAANQNHHYAQYFLGIIYSKNSSKCDIYKAIYYYKKAADAGHSKAQLELGQIYYIGGFFDANILLPNINDSLNNCPKKNNLLDLICLKSSNKCITRDINKAIHYLTLSADQNNIDAINFLGCIYLKGDPELHDIHKAIHYFTISAKYNDSRAQQLLELIYSDVKYIKYDINKNIDFLKLSTKNSTFAPFAYYILGKVYMKINIYDAINFLKQAADLNHSKAQLELGLMYYKGKYISQDISKSIFYFAQAANQNEQEAQYSLVRLVKNVRLVIGTLNFFKI